jgi:hypothetical protein
LNREPYSTRYTLPKRSKIHNLIKNEKEKLEEWLGDNASQKDVIAFRSGNLLTNKNLFYALKDLGFRMDSSIPAQFDWSWREIIRKVLYPFPDSVKTAISKVAKGRIYKTLPLGTGLFYIEGILELPIHVYAGGRYLRRGWLIKRTKLQLSKVSDLVVYWHPCEVVYNRGIYRDYLTFLAEMNCDFRTFRQVEAWK